MDPRDQSLMEEMVSEILRQTLELELERRLAFLTWLQAHCQRLNAGRRSLAEIEAAAGSEADLQASLRVGLQTWFESLSAAGLLWEFRLLMNEISWWQSLEEVKCSSF